MSLIKRNALIAAGIGLYAANLFFPLVSTAESIAANTAQTVLNPATQSQVMIDGQAIQYYMLDTSGQDRHQNPDRSKPDNSVPENTLGSVSPWRATPLLLGEPSALLDDIYLIERPEQGPLAIKVEKEAATGFASISVNDQVVMKFRNGIADLDAYDRAHIVAQRLQEFLSDVYLSEADEPISIRPAYEDKQHVIKVGEEVLATIDEDAALANKMSESTLAYVWTNQLRDALGLPELDLPASLKEPSTPVVSNKGVSKKYKLPLSTAYFASTGHKQSGGASWYGPGFHGRRAADGSRFDMNQMTAAHRSLPFGTVVKVKNTRNGKECLVQITDRGPYAHGRIIDLSKAAAKEIGMLGSGTAHVTVEVLSPKKSQPAPTQDIAGAASKSQEALAKN